MNSIAFNDRLLVYLMLRGARRMATAIDRGSLDWDEAVRQQVKQLRKQMIECCKIDQLSTHQSDNHIVRKADRYSRSLFVPVGNAKLTLTTLSATDLGEEYDIIVTDPPYGVNTDEETYGLAKLYVEALRKILSCLKNDGQLVLCLPLCSYNGRRMLRFTHPVVVTRQVLAIAADLGREVVVVANANSHPPDLFRPPFYWESDRALQRRILHFRIRDPQASTNTAQ